MLTNLMAKFGGIEIVVEALREDKVSGALLLSVPSSTTSLESGMSSSWLVRFVCARISPRS